MIYKKKILTPLAIVDNPYKHTLHNGIVVGSEFNMNNKVKVYLYDDFGLFTPYYSSIYNTSISINNNIIISRLDNLPEYLELSVGDILDIVCIYAPSSDRPSGGTNSPLPRATGLTTISMDYTNAFSVSYRLDDDALSEYSITIYNGGN